MRLLNDVAAWGGMINGEDSLKVEIDLLDNHDLSSGHCIIGRDTL